MREVKDPPGPGHEGNGGVVVPPFYAQQKQQHAGLIPPHTMAHQQRPNAPSAMRGSPSPASTTPHSPHMTPSGGGPGSVMPPHPGALPNDNTRMHAPGYPPSGSPHMPSGPGTPHGYPTKMGHMVPGPSGPGYGQPGYQHPPGHQYPTTRPPGHMMQGYPQGYPPGAQQPPTSLPPGHQYNPRPPHNSHVPPGQPPYVYSHFSQPGWAPPGSPMPGSPSMISGQGMPGKPSGPMAQTTQPGANSVGGPRPQTPPHYLKPQLGHKMGSYPPTHQMYPNGPGMPPMINNREGHQNSMPPPTTSSQPATINSTEGEPHLNSSSIAPAVPNNIVNNVNSHNPPQIGPDGNPVLDDCSQQSTVSNTSAASDDRSCTPKPHKEGMLNMPGGSMMMPHHAAHPPTPKNSASSPGPGSITSQPEDPESLSSPNWPRSPAGNQVFVNNQPPPPPEIFRSGSKGDSLMRLYEMSDSPDRKAWLDKLLRFMDDNKTPITVCPTISKNPLDLYALYLHVKEKGGFEEITKNKQWKDIAAAMGIGASSSGSYTLRKHYMKHILAYECKFDLGGVDPQPIINQIESTQKKKNAKSMSVPSPGSNNSSLDGFTNGPHMPGTSGMSNPYPQYPPSTEYPGHMPQRHSTQTNPGYQSMTGNQYSGYQVMHGPYGSGSYPNPEYKNMSYQSPPGPPNSANYPGYQQPPGYPRPGYPPTQQPYPSDQYTMGNNATPNSYGSSQLAKQLMNPPRPGGPVMQPYQNSTMYSKPGAAPSPGPPPPSSTQPGYQPRRHPDFDKAQGWRSPSPFPGYGSQPNQGPPQQPWPRPTEPGPPSGPPQWSQPRFPSQAAPNFPNTPRWSASNFVQSTRPQISNQNQKNFSLAQTAFKSTGYGTYMGKQLFPMDSVEAVSPVLIKRRRMCRNDVPPVDAWRLLMSLRCGLASEVTWALDVLNILLFDDSCVLYFGLHHMPGLLDSLIEHFRRGLMNMFNICSELEFGSNYALPIGTKESKTESKTESLWFTAPPRSPSIDLDLGKSEDDHDPDDKEVLLKGTDYTYSTRTAKTVRIVKRESRLFVKEGVRDWDKWGAYDPAMDSWSVGAGECTGHIICSMGSSVPPLRFTRLLCDAKKTESDRDESSDKVPAVIKLDEQVVVDDEIGKSHCEGPVKEIVAEPLSMPEQKKTDDSDKCNGLKELFSKGCKGGRKNAKSLDDILKRIKKEPSDASSPSIFNKNKTCAKEKDSKTLLDLILQKDVVAEGKCAPAKEKLEVTQRPATSSNAKTSLLKIVDAKLSGSNVEESHNETSGFKRTYQDLEEESWNPDEASLCTTTEGQEWLAKRVVTIGTVVRNLSFIPGNEDVMSKSAPLLALLGKTILLHHDHPSRAPNTTHYDRDEETDFSDWCSSLSPDTYWYWTYLHHVHENTLVTLANMAGYLDLSLYPEEISRSILNGLLHWATCPASYGQDPLPGGGISHSSALSPQRLALEALVKLCVLDANTDLLLATPPFSRLDMLCSQLTRLLCRGEDQVLREFSVNLLHYFSAADSGIARLIAMQNGCVSLLTSFIEEAESNAMGVANAQGVHALKENPELMGTSLDMVRRAASTLVNLSRVPDNYRVISACESRLLQLVMSQILDTYVASQLSQVLFYVVQARADNGESPPCKSSSFLETMSYFPLSMDCLDSFNSKNRATEVRQVPEEELMEVNKDKPKTDSPSDVKSPAHTLKPEVPPVSESKTEVAPESTPCTTTIPSTPSSPASLVSHSSVSPNSNPSSLTEAPTLTSHLPVCNRAAVGGTKPTPQVTPPL